MMNRSAALRACNRPLKVRARVEAARARSNALIEEFLAWCDLRNDQGISIVGTKEYQRRVEEMQRAYDVAEWYAARAEDLENRAWERFNEGAYREYVIAPQVNGCLQTDVYQVTRSVNTPVQWREPDGGASGVDYETCSHESRVYGTALDAADAAWMLRCVWRLHEAGGRDVCDISVAHYDSEGTYTYVG